ncbi:MAG: hypothetical protein ACYTG2_17505 [Planctomycetota bacterium]|jgi:hypothetical protein
MMKTTATLALCAAVALAATIPAQPVVTGDGDIVSPVAGPLHIELSLVRLPSGELVGQARQESPITGGYNVTELTSAMAFGDTLCVAGTVTESVDTPIPVGFTQVFCIEDNGDGGSVTPDRIARIVAPLPPGTTVQDIAMLFPGFLPGPSSQYLPLTGGNFTIH